MSRILGGYVEKLMHESGSDFKNRKPSFNIKIFRESRDRSVPPTNMESQRV